LRLESGELPYSQKARGGMQATLSALQESRQRVLKGGMTVSMQSFACRCK